jgi:predicted Ser/Thr protein kinase
MSAQALQVWDIDEKELVIGDEIAKGSFGKVYEGTYFSQKVAIKDVRNVNVQSYLAFLRVCSCH